MSREAWTWVRSLAATFDNRGRQATPGRLEGAARSALLIAADWAGDGGDDARKAGLVGERHLVTLGTRRWAAEAGVDRSHLLRLLPQLVDLKVLEVALAGAGQRTTWYRFTLRDPDGLPERLSKEPPPPPAEQGIDEVDWRAALNHKPEPDQPPATGRPRRPQPARGTGRPGRPQLPPGEAATGRPGRPQRQDNQAGVVVASDPVSGRLDPGLWSPRATEPLTPQPPPSGGRVVGGESNERAGQPPEGAGAGQAGTTKPGPGPSEPDDDQIALAGRLVAARAAGEVELTGDQFGALMAGAMTRDEILGLLAGAQPDQAAAG